MISNSTFQKEHFRLYPWAEIHLKRVAGFVLDTQEELTIVNPPGFENMNKLGVDKSSNAELKSWPKAVSL